MMDEFIYDDEAPYAVNFNRWFYACNAEREMYKEVKINIEEAERTFKRMYGFKQLSNVVFVN